MRSDLCTVALRYNAIYLPAPPEGAFPAPEAAVPALVAALAQAGYELDERAYKAVCAATPDDLAAVVKAVKEAYGLDLNWASLIKDWQRPVGVTRADYVVTYFANLFPQLEIPGTTLPCGHLIPDGTFPLERYNGCPFCGTPFVYSKLKTTGTGSRKKILTLWTDRDMEKLLRTLMSSPLPLGATQKTNLAVLLGHYPLPEGVPTIGENALIAAAILVAADRFDEAARLITDPAGVFRLLWYRHTGSLRFTPPSQIIERRAERCFYPAEKAAAVAEAKAELRLHYTRTQCRNYAQWLNRMEGSAEKKCALMHPRREEWVRFIRALRLTEFARKPGYERLAELLDVFYRGDYPVWAGELEGCRLRNDTDGWFALLEERPGLFARALFASMLRFGADKAVDSFRKVLPKLPVRLLLSLMNNAETYFLPQGETRLITLPGGARKEVPVNPLRALYDTEQRREMVKAVQGLYLDAMRHHFENSDIARGSRVYVAPTLYDIPVPVADRSETVQDTACAVPGEKFKVEGNKVRLFLQWGKGLPAQHLDMDLSCKFLYADGSEDDCAYYNLSIPGAVHSGDIQHIPDYIGTAEYIELDIDELARSGCVYAVFTCNAYTAGALDPGLVVGWMDSANPMKVDNETGVAYDPSTVSHQIRVASKNLAKGLVFGVLDVAERRITWLEMSFGGRNIEKLNLPQILALLQRLDNKVTLGQLVEVLVETRELEKVDEPGVADVVFDSAADVLAVL